MAKSSVIHIRKPHQAFVLLPLTFPAAEMLIVQQEFAVEVNVMGNLAADQQIVLVELVRMQSLVISVYHKVEQVILNLERGLVLISVFGIVGAHVLQPVFVVME